MEEGIYTANKGSTAWQGGGEGGRGRKGMAVTATCARDMTRGMIGEPSRRAQDM